MGVNNSSQTNKQTRLNKTKNAFSSRHLMFTRVFLLFKKDADIFVVVFVIVLENEKFQFLSDAKFCTIRLKE